VLHPDFFYNAYSGEAPRNDYQLVVLKEPVFDVPVVELNRKSKNPRDNGTRQSLTAIGLGDKSEWFGGEPKFLQKVRVQYVPYEECRAAYEEDDIDPESHLCAGGEKNQGPCYGTLRFVFLDIQQSILFVHTRN